jgi:hypothetical protein
VNELDKRRKHVVWTGTYANDKEYTGKHCCGHGVQNLQQRACHRTPNGQTHQEVTDTLLNNSSSFDDWFTNLTSIFRFDDIELGLVDGQRVGMDGCLGDETVRERKTNDTADETSATEEEEVPMEASGLCERVLTSLRCEGRYILVEFKYALCESRGRN